jgi:hypothetical protein
VTSPAINLFTALCGLGLGIVLVAGLLQRHSTAQSRWVAAASLVSVVVLAAGLPGKLNGDLNTLRAERRANTSVSEQQAHERCLRDLGRGDLVDALAFTRERIPGDARYYVRTPSIPCVAFNLFPSELVRVTDFDPRRDWLVLDRANLDDLPEEVQSAARATDRRVEFSPSFALVAPEGVSPGGGTQ